MNSHTDPLTTKKKDNVFSFVGGYCQLIHKKKIIDELKRKGNGEQREAWDTQLLADQFHSGHLIPDLEFNL